MSYKDLEYRDMDYSAYSVECCIRDIQTYIYQIYTGYTCHLRHFLDPNVIKALQQMKKPIEDIRMELDILEAMLVNELEKLEKEK